MKKIIDFLTDFLANAVDKFKMKNATAYTIIALLLGTVYYISTQLLTADLTGELVIQDSLRKIVQSIQNIIVLVLTLLGAHTPKK
ncbi:MAG TPA: hypothetical protein PKD70_06310 [Saprospiraceae bacterium]|nr:hypothetical protein [Saprospiraceae bacterium]HMP13471.1 hypothetical protein [Saprospiraceae bacterium]